MGYGIAALEGGQGFKRYEADDGNSNRIHRLKNNLRLNLIILSAMLFVVGFVLEWQTASALLVRLFYIGALLSGGFYIARSALASVRYLSIDMSVLMSIAIIGAFSMD